MFLFGLSSSEAFIKALLRVPMIYIDLQFLAVYFGCTIKGFIVALLYGPVKYIDVQCLSVYFKRKMYSKNNKLIYVLNRLAF